MSPPCSAAARQLGLPGLLPSAAPSSVHHFVATPALVLMRLLLPASRLATARKLAPDAEFAALNEALGLGPVSEQQLYDTLDWLARRQPAIEAKLARRGYSRDGKRGSRQILVGLLCDAAGRPVSAEVCAGNTADPATVPAQVDKLRRRFGLSRVVLVCRNPRLRRQRGQRREALLQATEAALVEIRRPPSAAPARCAGTR